MPPPTKNGRVRKSLRRKIKKQEVIKIFQIMENQQNTSNGGGSSGAPVKPGDLKNDFYNTGRVGRRNAMPDILGNNCTTSTADLPDKLSSLSTEDKPSSDASPGPSRLNIDQNVAGSSNNSPQSGNS